MDIKEIQDELKQLIYYELVVQSPVLSGNMQNFISGMGFQMEGILITAPSYDMKKWRKDKEIVHNYKFNYANAVNEVGAFGTHNKSEHWVNRVCNMCSQMIASKYHGKVIVRLAE